MAQYQRIMTSRRKVAFATAALLFAATGCSGDPSGSEGTDEQAQSKSTSVADLSRADRRQIKSDSKDVVDVASDLSAFEKKGNDLVIDDALTDLQAQAEEYEQNGWRVRGRPTVVSQKIISRDGDKVVVEACVDDSKVRIMAKDGTKVRRSGGRALNVISLQKSGNRWVVSKMELADDPDC